MCYTGTEKAHTLWHLMSILHVGKNLCLRSHAHTHASCAVSPAALLWGWQQLSAFLLQVSGRVMQARSSLANTPIFLSYWQNTSFAVSNISSSATILILCFFCLFGFLVWLFLGVGEGDCLFKATEIFYYKEHAVARILPPKLDFILQTH